MTNEEKFNLITRNLEEVLTEEELKSLINSGIPLRHYIGFEISGKGHMGWVYTMQKIKDLQDAGVEIQILLADWHTWLNKKLDGTLETAKRLAREYFEKALKAAALCAGANPDKINFVLGSDLYEKLGNDYWANVVRVAKATTLARMIRSTTIMGRKESEISDTAMLIYPAMQSADIFALGANIAHAGTDQRNVHVVARESAQDLGERKPVAIHHHLLLGLLQPVFTTDESGKKVLDIEAAKMSKSKPDSAVFIHDYPDEIKRKVNNAFCPEGEIAFNPILDWTKNLVFYEENGTLQVSRKPEHGGNVTYNSFNELQKDYASKKLHPMDLKTAVAEWLIKKLEPARRYFEDPKRRKALEEIEKLTKLT
ncbi:MAG: tyrosyl-tRNA synthetase [Microgenomates group bacterium Gr01-1014_7]|nr:MAG: tyrosyl-tRNA synthetase [Microgenomates group bacterium Gr01-1014_7]